MRAKLTDDQVRTELSTLGGWVREGDSLTKTFRFAKFADGIAFVQRVATAADAADHHPDIDIRYTKIRVALSTHDAGGITAADVKLAKQIEQLEPVSRRTNEKAVSGNCRSQPFRVRDLRLLLSVDDSYRRRPPISDRIARNMLSR